MKKKGKFILFTLDEFAKWLEETHFNRVIKLIQNHHTYIPNYSHFKGSNHFELLTGMENSHLERGFTEIAQNLTTFPDGKIALCRALDKIPAGIKGANQTGICIEHLGNFDIGADSMLPSHQNTIIKINMMLCKKFKLTPSSDTIVYHHWYDLNSGERTGGTGSTKSCPGTNFFGGNTVDIANKNFIPQIKKGLTTPSQATEPKGLKTGTVKARTLNVRNAPSTSAPIVKKLNKGIKVNIYEEKNGWYRINQQQQDWVLGKYIVI